ncbi:CPBP family intramembrane glutamic endopeptidase [Sphingosinicella rhizophila]|uniref:CPBP family intramembrane glutamic endopeptidase n=1 Tax=Sphingosinicella rhizophila TaxID=3050082 RepID=A0ABU3Q3Y3_9SPHN|nr:CPBP family intramembrane glutamic endopeptidase [Sphingosinicella sp. GR2756]MDT9598125.1 CPBP family intramembrane glutamic endopeptidase [Sphingosinicella sp. GR2756]
MNRPILVFVAIVYGLSVALGLLIGLTGREQSPFMSLGIAAMLFPAMALLVVGVAMNAKVADFGWKRFPPRYGLLALFLIPGVMHLAMIPATAALVGELPWENWLTPRADGLFNADERGWGTLTPLGLAGRLALNAAIGLVAVTLLAFFEEIGWRAWLLPRLAERLGWRRAIMATAALWAVWHTPFALSGVHTLPDISVTLTALVLPVGHLGAGFIIGWLWMRSRSIWIVMIAHGALNNWGQYAFKFMQDIGPDALWILLVGNVALLATGGILLVANRSPEPDSRHG